MATMVVLNGHNTGDWYTLGERPMVFGRDSSLLAELLDPCVSRRHMEVRYEARDNAFYAVDSGSRNGVLVNGKRINRFQALNDGDLIQLGFTLLTYTAQDFDDYKAAEAFVNKVTKQNQKLISELEEAEQKRLEKSLDGTMGFHVSA